MKTYSVFLQGYDSYGVLQYKVLKYKCVEFDAEFVIEKCERQFKLKSVQINHFIEVKSEKK
jgi:hypothetical protein